MHDRSDSAETRDPGSCPRWCASGHGIEVPDEHGQWFAEHRSDDFSMIFSWTGAEEMHGDLGFVYTSQGLADDPARDEPRRVTLRITTEPMQETWLSPVQARILAGHLLAAADDIEAGR